MDEVSLNSSSSDNPLSEFVLVPSVDSNGVETGLKIAGNGDEIQLKKHLAEMIASNESSIRSNSVSDAEAERFTEEGEKQISEDENKDRPYSLNVNLQSEDGDAHEKTPTKASSNEHPLKDEDCILFSKVYYLGCTSINSPRSEAEALKAVSILRSQQRALHDPHKQLQLPAAILPADDEQLTQQIEVVLSVPRRADGAVRLLEPTDSTLIASYNLFAILFCVRGADGSNESDCFAFTESHQSSGIFQCHVFRCDVPEAVRKVLYSFELAFQSIPKSPNANVQSPSAGLQLLRRSQDSGSSSSPQTDGANSNSQATVDESLYSFNVSLEVREDDGKGGFATVPWDKTSSCFKFRCNLKKQVIMTVSQTSNVQLTIERCFGLLLTPGRNVKQSDMHLLDMERSATDYDETLSAAHVVVGTWEPSQPKFALLNNETQKGTRVFLSVAVDFVVQEIQEPVRFLVETKARVFPQNEKFWYFGRKVLHEDFFVRLREIDSEIAGRQMFEVESIESESTRSKRSLSSHTPQQEQFLSSSSPQDEEDDDDTDEPLLSGSGEVNRDCPDRVLSDWGIVLNRWRADLSRRPTGIRALVRSGAGIPNPLRGEVWQLLAGCHSITDMLEEYRVLITKDSSQEKIIQRDIHRTFPAHDYFKDAGGHGQDSLYRISKAYSVYDQEVGYCQGLSFLAAALLLHMPEEQAFCVLIKVMFPYKMRNLFKNGFEDLHLKFYQLERLTEDLLPNLYDHFKELSVEFHMFSSQWFLTLFTAKFPLNMVFHVIDIFLCEGELVVFQVALGLLECCRQELLTLDFEGVLKYFRVQLPKKYRSEDQVKLLIQTAVHTKVTRKRLERYEKDYTLMKEKLALEEDPLIRIERENKQLMESNMRLELENDEIAQELISSRITLTTQLERTMRHADNLQRDLQGAVSDLRTSRSKVSEQADENNRLHDENKQVKEMCRREMARQDEDIVAKTNIIADYKTICSQLSQRIERMQATHKEELEAARMTQSGAKGDEMSQGAIERQAREEVEKLQKQTRALELELAQTKLKLVESECRVQDVEHQLIAATKEMQASKNTWFQKTLSSLTARKPDNPASFTPPTPQPADICPSDAHVTTTMTSYGRQRITS